MQMQLFKSVPAAVLATLLVASGIGYYLTRDIGTPSGQSAPPAGQQSSIDNRLLQTARALTATTETPDERAFSAEADRLADHELDQAFASALRQTTVAAAKPKKETQQLSARVGRLRDTVARDQDRVDQLTKADPESSDLALVKAQLALDQDELDDAQQDLARAGGDPRAAIMRTLQEHEAAEKMSSPPAPPTNPPADTVAGYTREWVRLNQLRGRIDDARQEASAKAKTLSAEHDQLEKSRGAAAPAADQGDNDVRVRRLVQLSNDVKTMRELDSRIQDVQQLGAVYGKWEQEVAGRRRAAVHDLLRSWAFVLVVLFAALLAIPALRRVLDRHTDRRRAQHLRFIVTVAVQLVAAGIVLLLIFGQPTQLSTVIGLATAGLTVVLKDFVVAFFGWFVLIGRNGLRVGDWVEINGVSGEVIEIGLLRTVLLEMGNWTNTGHPTGRRVAFMNGFAIEGHYFNFSTAGQWLWDEVRVTVPAGGDPYRMAEEIRDTVERATGADAQQAAQEWERVTRQYGTRPFSARPAVELRPTGGGIEVVVRYISRAPQRDERKTRVHQDIVALLHGGRTK